MKIACIDKEVKVILESGYYKIPRFQRPYSWDRENIEELWIDTIENSDPDYFIGSMVVFKEGNDIFGVVDGQQRLTTITMILAAIRNRFEQENLLDLAKGIHRLIERADINNKDLFILQTETSYPYLQEYIQKFGRPEIQPKIQEEEEVLKKSFQIITEKVNKLLEDLKPNLFVNEEERKENIKRSLSYARDKILGLKLIFVEVDNEDDAYMIFETLNTRGKDLGVSDLVKNHITRLLRPRNAGVDLVKDKWKDIRQTIEGSQSDISLDEYLHHFWLSRYDYVTAKNLFKNLKDVIGKDQKRANTFLEDLLYDSQIYREINEPLSRKWAIEEASIRDSLIALKTPSRIVCKDGWTVNKQAERGSRPFLNTMWQNRNMQWRYSNAVRKKRFERHLLHRENSNKHLPLAHPFRLVALKLVAPYASAFNRWESLANEYPA